MQTYTRAQVLEHNKEDDCYLIVHNKVYNMTSYLDDHPGGSELMMQHAGKDASLAFEAMFHSANARTKLDQFCVGQLPNNEWTNTPKKVNLF